MDYAERYDRWQNLPQMYFEKADERGAAAMFWAKRYDAWRLEAMYDLQDDRVIRQWVEDSWDGNKELYVQLAYTDGK